METRLDLKKALPNGYGSIIPGFVEPVPRPAKRWEWQPIIAWVAPRTSAWTRSSTRY